MNCRSVQKHLSAFADGGLPGFRRRAVASHLEECPACRISLSSLHDLNRILQEDAAPPVPEGFCVRVLARATRTERAPEGSFGWLLDPMIDALGKMSIPMRLAACGTVLAASLVGVLMAERLLPAARTHGVVVAVQQLAGLEWFGAAPPASVAAAYLAAAPVPSRAEGDAR
jgi:anti-sigma factor RsiW